MIISDKLNSLLTRVNSVCVLTGAGISAESGVETFRGARGLWSKFKPQELADFDAFIRNPELVWEWYNYRKKIIRDVKPNAGHMALAKMEKLVKDFSLVTQNIDNLHFRAGNKKVLELHGNIERSYCIDCGKFADNLGITPEGKMPKCPLCNGFVRPDVVWFGEMLPTDVFEEAVETARRCELFLVVGTSAVVYPAAGLPITAKAQGAYTVEVNTEPTEISHIVNETLKGKAGDILPGLVALLEETRRKNER
ncbi:MAG: NAD-dependent deacylase [Bacteroidetes bacterium]|nr:NAD-dependent deacylase [Bacteroidota bacterium]